MWLVALDKPSIPSHAQDWLSTKEIKMSQKDINWKIIGAQDVLATKIKSYQKPVSVVILWLGHEIKIFFSFVFQISRPDYKIYYLVNATFSEHILINFIFEQCLDIFLMFIYIFFL